MTTLVQDLQTVLNPLAVGGASYGARTVGDQAREYIVWQRVYYAAGTPTLTGFVVVP